MALRLALKHNTLQQKNLRNPGVEDGFDPPLPDQDACTIELDCGASVCVRGLEDDVDGNGVTATTDAGIIKFVFGQTPTDLSARYDVDVNGIIATTDFAVVKPRFGNTAPACP